MQIPELSLFWLLTGAFIAAGVTWWLDAILIKRRANNADHAALAALHEKARQIEPLSQKLRNATTQIEELEARLAEVDHSAHIDQLSAHSVELEQKLGDALRAEEEASRLTQAIKQELANKVAEISSLNEEVSEARSQLEQQRQSANGLMEQAAEAQALRQTLSELKQRFDDLQATAPSEGELSNLRLRAEHSEAEVERMRGELEQSVPMQRVSELEEQVRELQSHLASQVQSTEAEFESEREGMLASIAKLQSQLIESDEVVENFRTQLAAAHTALSDQATEPQRIQDLETALAERNAEVERYNRRIPELETLIHELRHDAQVKAAAIEHLQSSSEADDLRATIAQLHSELESLRQASHADRSQLVQARAEAELLREARPVVTPAAEVSSLEERMNDLFGAVQASHREAAENRRALQIAMEEIRQLQVAMAKPAATDRTPKPKTSPRKKVASGGSVRAELTESSDLGELA